MTFPSSRERDPFPMQSEEAKRLERSVNARQDPEDDRDRDHHRTQAGNNSNASTNAASDDGARSGALSSMAWNTMGTTTLVRPSNDDDDDDDDGTHGPKYNTDIYESESALIYNQKVKGKKSSKTQSIYDEMDVQTKAEKYLDTHDEYLDHPLDDRGRLYSSSGTVTGAGAGAGSGGNAVVGCMFKYCCKPLQKHLLTVHRYLYGDKVPPSEIIRTLCLASTLFFMIGGYWLLRSLKDPVLTALCGVTAIPKAKMLSVLVVLVVVSVYNRLLDHPHISKHSLFYIFGMFYFGLFTMISICLAHPTMGLANSTPSYGRILGWVSYCSIESFGSVMVSLFWSFCNSNFKLESAKACYGLLVATAQIGSILGPTVVTKYTKSLGVAKVYFLGALAMLLLQGTLFLYVKIYGTQEETAAATAATAATTGKTKKSAGILEGLHLFVRYNYVKGIFAISCLFMVEVTIVDYTMKILARDHFAGLYPCTECWDGANNNSNNDHQATGMSQEATEAFTTFMGLFGQATNTLSFLLSFFGTGAIIRKLGLRLALLLFPTLCLIVIVIVRMNPTLYVVFAAMMVLKANSYALNNPTKEMLYQPTSSAVRYKAKSWIDSFGARGSKALGSVVTNAFSDSATNLVHNGSLVGMAVASFLIWNARFMGKSFENYVATGYIVGEENDDDMQKDGDHFELAMGQNEAEDTSCAIYDDDDDADIKESVSDHNLEKDGDDASEEGDEDSSETEEDGNDKYTVRETRTEMV